MTDTSIFSKEAFRVVTITLLFLLAFSILGSPSNTKINAHPKVDPGLTQLEQAVEDTEAHSLIIKYTPATTSIAALEQQVVRFGGSLTKHFEFIESVVVNDASPALINALAQHPQVAYISHNSDINLAGTVDSHNSNIANANHEGAGTLLTNYQHEITMRSTNLALDGVASQSSIRSGGAPERAIDGIVDG
ncbi:MAG: hypothetical protein AAGD96_15730, partial [Chloroflexota bacterium]